MIQRVASSRRCQAEGGEKAEGEDGEEGFLAHPTSSSYPGGGGGVLEGLHLVLFRTMQKVRRRLLERRLLIGPWQRSGSDYDRRCKFPPRPPLSLATAKHNVGCLMHDGEAFIAFIGRVCDVPLHDRPDQIRRDRTGPNKIRLDYTNLD